jgi:hypothetical protein
MKKKSLYCIPHSLLALLLTCGLAVAADRPQLKKIEHTILSPASEQVVLQLNGSYSPKVFTLKDETPRVIFDFADMVHTRDVKSVTTTNGSMVKRVRVGMHTDDSPKTRVVLDLATLKGVSYTQKFDEKSSSLIIELSGPKKVAAHPARKTEPVEKTAEVQPPEVSEAQSGTTTHVDPKGPLFSSQQQTDQAGILTEKTAKEPSPEGRQSPEPVVEAVAAVQPEDRKSGTETTQSPLKAASESAGTEEKAAAKPQLPSPVEPAPETAAQAAPAGKTEPSQATDATAAAVIESPAAAPPTDEKKEEGEKTKAEAVTREPPPQGHSVEPPVTAGKEATPTDANSKTEKAEDAVAVTADGPELEYVKFDATSPKGEMVMFKLNGFHPPAVHGVEEGIPRVICDFNNTKLTGRTKNQIKTDGKFVKVIRTSKTRKPEKVRVVIDLEPNHSYDLQQVFFKEDNLFVIIVNTVKK